MCRIERSRMGHTNGEWLGPYRDKATKKKETGRTNGEQSGSTPHDWGILYEGRRPPLCPELKRNSGYAIEPFRGQPAF